MKQITQEIRDQFESLQNQLSVWLDKENAIKEAKQRVLDKIQELSSTEGVYVGIVTDDEKLLYPVSEVSNAFNPHKGDKFFFSLEDAKEEGFVLGGE